MSRKIQGQVITVTDRGNLVTDITAEQLSSVPDDLRVRVTCDEHFTQGIFRTGHNEPDFTFLAVLGDSHRLELEMVGENASRMLGIGVGERVIVEWE